MAAIRLVHDGTTLELSQPDAFPQDSALRLLQPVEKSSGGEPLPCDYLAEEGLITLMWPDMLLTEFTNLTVFFTDEADGIHNTITYYAADGGSKTVRFAYPKIEWQKVAHDKVAVKIYFLEA